MSKLKVEEFKIEAALGQRYTCDCGRVHQSNLQDYMLEVGAAERLPELIKRYGYRQILLVADKHTMAAAGNKIVEAFQAHSDFELHMVVYDDEELIPNEKALDRLREAAGRMEGIDCYLAVGSGTLNDLTRYVSYEAKLPYMVFATAPSMDGYASGVSPLILNQMKQTFPAQSPFAIVSDPEVLAAAPAPMIQAGVGDVFGKYSSLLDWQLSARLYDEYYCPEIVKMVEQSREAVRAATAAIAARDPEAIRLLFEALVEVGIAMDYSGNSRPASGAEHHLAHFWEMQFLFAGKVPILHGLKVGVALPIILKAYQQLAACPLDFDFAAARDQARAFDSTTWVKEIDVIYGPAAPAIKQLADSENLLSIADRLACIDAIEANWSEVISLAQSAVKPDDIQALYDILDFPDSPGALGVSDALVGQALGYAKDLRSRYTILRLFDDLGIEFYA